MAKPTTDRIRFNVGGKIFETTSTTIAKAGKSSLLGALLDDQGKMKMSCKNSEYFIDRNPKYFSVLLDLLRTGELDIPSTINERFLFREALYYGLENHVRLAKWDPYGDNCVRFDRPLSGREPVVQAKPISVNFQQTSKKGPDHKKKGKNLVGSKIKVWWPNDKAFYEAVVASYNNATKKHKIIYDDGDVEKLNLDNERWEYVESSYMSDSELTSKDGFDAQANRSIVKVSDGMFDEHDPISLGQQKSVMMPGQKKLGEHLVGSKIKVWWPQEKSYYDAVVVSYYCGTKQHKVVYSDGDVELLVLKNERWKFAESSDIMLEPRNSKSKPNVKGGIKNYHKDKSQGATGLSTSKKVTAHARERFHEGSGGKDTRKRKFLK